jgi:hypothetical protein
MRRPVILIAVMLTLMCGYGVWRHAKRVVRQQSSQQRYADREGERDRAQKIFLRREASDDPPVGENFARASLQGETISRPGNAFQNADFRSADLNSANLTAGGSSFQMANFEGADLTNARLNGNFQMASFENSELTGASWEGSFDGCNISGACFAGAKLLAVRASSLENSHFAEPPTYDSATVFRGGFDPVLQGWRRLPQLRHRA